MHVYLYALSVDHPAEDGLEDDLQIQPKGPIFDVPDVVLDALGDAGVPAEAVDLCPAGDARPHLVFDHVQGHGLAELLHEIWDLGPRADQAHIAPDHVPQLGQLVQAELAQEGADPGTPVVVGRGPGGILGVVHPHAAEFQHREDLLVQAHALLLEQHRARTGQLDRDRDEQQQRAQQDQRDQAGDDVEGALDHGVERLVQRRRAQLDQLDGADIVDVRLRRDDIVVERDHADPRAALLAQLDDLHRHAQLLRLQCEDHLVDAVAVQLRLQPFDPVVALRWDDARQVHAQRLVLLHRLGIALGQMAAANHQVVLQVVALRPEIAQRIADDQPLAHHGGDDRDIVDAEHASRELLQAEQVEQRGCRDQREQVAQHDAADLLRDLLDARHPVHAKRAEHDHRPQRIQRRRQRRPVAQVGQRRHVRVLRHDAQPEPRGEHVGQEHQQRVGEYVHSIQLCLVASYHKCICLFQQRRHKSLLF